MKLGSDWQKSNRSNTNGACVEARLNENMIEVRNSRDPNGPIVSFTQREWEAFIGGVADGEFQLP